MRNKVALKVISLVMGACAVGSAVGCNADGGPVGSNVDNPDQVNIDLDRTITATLTISCDASNDEQRIVETLAAGFNELYPNVTVKVDPLSGDLVSTLMGYAGAGTMPDIFQTSSFNMLNLQDVGIIQSLDPFIEAETENGTFDVSDYYEDFWTLGQKDFDGAQLMIPRAADQVVCHYNAKIVKACSDWCGVDLEATYIKNGWTWNDFLTVCKYLRSYYDATGRTNNYLLDGFLDWEAVFNPILESFGVEYFNETGECTIDCEGTGEALELIKNIIDKRYHGRFSGSQANFSGGQGVFMFHSQDATTQIKNLAIANLMDYSKMDENYYNVVTFPIVNPENPKIGCGVSGYAVSQASANKDLAWQFLKFMLSKDGQNCIADSGKNFPPIRIDMADPKNPDNHWGKGLECYNLEAFTWASTHNAIAPTTYITARPARATDLNDTVGVMIGNYVDLGYTMEKALSKAKASMEYWLEN